VILASGKAARSLLLVRNKLTGTTATAYHTCYHTMLMHARVKGGYAVAFGMIAVILFWPVCLCWWGLTHQAKSCRLVSSAQKVSPRLPSLARGSGSTGRAYYVSAAELRVMAYLR